ncbi:MAG: hypothetical protein M3503_03540 [Actinomycetota bacterium]|nr:hypothetical protein [Actinomycetota bacterium]
MADEHSFGTGDVVGLEGLVDVLDCERHLLEKLLFRLVEARNLLATGEARFLGWAASDIEDATAAVRDVESRRAAITGDLRHGRPPTVSMLVASATEPWSTLLADHRRALGRLAGEVGAAIEAAHDMALAGLAQVQLAGTTGLGPTEAAPVGEHLGARSTRLRKPSPLRERATSTQPRRALPLAGLDDLDREITAAGYEAILATTSRMALPSLVAFLR